MRLPRTRIEHRGGFTLIELLVVIAIIAVLASLLTSGVVVTLNKLDEVKTQHEITALSSGITQFKNDFNARTPAPSRLWLDETGRYNTPPAGYTLAQVQQLGIDSVAYLRMVWPNINLAGGIDWNSDGIVGNSNFILEGQQCLVFFLGGARLPNGSFVGFSDTNSSNPMDITNLNKRRGPYMQFDMTRIQMGANGYAQYADRYGTVYAYFSSGKSANGYNAYWNASSLNQPDCPSLTATNYSSGNAVTVSIQPYYSSQAAPFQYYNPDTYQIISAGKNMAFGPGGYWVSTLGDSGMGGIGSRDGLDDLTNFYGKKLGTMP